MTSRVGGPARSSAPTYARKMQLIGVYDADGGLRGEAAYVVGKLLGRRHCSLCDITHSGVRRKRAWDRFADALDLPFRLAHLNELTASEADAVAKAGAPVVLLDDAGGLEVLLDAQSLESAHGDVDTFAALVDAALRSRRPASDGSR